MDTDGSLFCARPRSSASRAANGEHFACYPRAAIDQTDAAVFYIIYTSFMSSMDTSKYCRIHRICTIYGYFYQLLSTFIWLYTQLASCVTIIRIPTLRIKKGAKPCCDV